MFLSKKIKLIYFILTRQGGSFGVHASSWWSQKSGFDEIDKTLRAYIIFQQHPRNPKNT